MKYQKFIAIQKFSNEPEKLILRLVNSIISLLLIQSKDNLQTVLKYIAIVSKTYNIPLSIKKDKTNVEKKQITNIISELLQNAKGYNETLQKTLNLLVSFAKKHNIKLNYT